MNTSDDKHIDEVLKFFYPMHVAGRLNQRLRTLAATMLAEALRASEAMNYVPRPAGARPGVFWLVMQGVQMFWRSVGPDGIYETVRQTVALKFRSEYDIARMVGDE